MYDILLFLPFMAIHGCIRSKLNMVYMLLDILEGKAADRQKLVELIMPVLNSIERITEDVCLLVNRENIPAPSFKRANTESYPKQAAANAV
jgi:hypothetical protein